MSLKNSEQLAWEAMEAGAYDRAVRLLQPLAEGNSEYGLLCLGYIYEMGKTGPPDMEAARSCYERAAARGSGAANFEIGRLLLGEGDEKQARRAFQRGTERGDLPSMAELGRMMVEGRGGSGDAAEGWAWLEKAAAQGHFYAQRTLLGIEYDNARSWSEKLFVKMKIAKLAWRGGRHMAKDPGSDKVR